MTVRAAAALMLALFVLSAGANEPDEADSGPDRVLVFAPLEVTAGDPFTVWVYGGWGFVLEIVSPAGRVVRRSEGMPVMVGPLTRFDWHLSGIEPTSAGGSYLLRVHDSDGEIAATRRLAVVPGDFRRETIGLSQSLTELRTTTDPRRDRETRELMDLIQSRDPSIRHHTGTFGWPLPPDTRRTSLYGDRRLFEYSDGTSAGSIHVGLDLAAPVGTPVVSSGSGVVRIARYRLVTGYSVVIEHLPGIYSLYYHLDSLLADEGARVETGDVIGTVGATGLATGPHLHWEFRVGGVPVSPTAMTARDLLRPPFETPPFEAPPPEAPAFGAP